MNNVFFKKKFDKKRILHSVFELFVVLLGTFIVSLGTGIFLTPFSIVSGGVSGLAILLSNAGLLSVDIWSYIICWFLFFAGLLILGLKFSLGTLASTIFYPIFVTLILRTGMIDGILNLMAPNATFEYINGVIQYVGPGLDAGSYLLFGIFGGAFVGIGCGITFIGGGSTGGFDILSFIINKFFGTNVSINSFFLDAAVVIAGIIVDIVSNDSTKFIGALVGIISALVCSVAIEFVYNGFNVAYICDVITSKPDEVTKYVNEKLDRTTTIINVVGGYSKENKKLVRIVCLRREYLKIKDEMAGIDSSAFMTFSLSKKVAGEGFSKNEKSSNTAARETINLIKKNKQNRDKKKKEENNGK
jgi:uncharacterized membrane-anchored protein YitT (DUF2179 family)